MTKLFSLIMITALLIHHVNGQTVKILTSGTKTSLRGLSVVTNKIIWASGSNGKVTKSNDGGKTWQWFTVKGFEKSDFRDIEAFNDSTAIIIAIDAPAYILKTTNSGLTWTIVYKNETKGMFLDAMDFVDDKHGVVVGDPIDGYFFIARTNDGGETWKEVSINERPVADSGEACFASSGTNIQMINKSHFALVSGGLSAHLFLNNKKLNLPILQGKESTGANSIAVKTKRKIIVVGGDFNHKDSTYKNCYITKNAGKSWHSPKISPSGYRSCVLHITKNNWITCGLNGVDFTHDNGRTFTRISGENFHVCALSKHRKEVFLAGNSGKIGFFSK